MYFLPYQVGWIRDGARLRICEKGRQIGLSYADAYDSVRKAAVAGGREVWVMSRDEAQAKQYIRQCKHWARILELAAGDLAEEVFRPEGGKPVRAQALSFASGASIYALSSNPDAIVGKSGHVKLDEFAIHKDQRTLYTVAKPVIQWGGTLSIISTHRGIGTVFNEILRDIRERGNSMGWSLHSVSIQKAVEQGLVERIEEAGGKGTEAREQRTEVRDQKSEGRGQKSEVREQKSEVRGRRREEWLAQQRAECIDEEQWLQEYCCVPADEASAFISYDLINACTEPDLRLMSMDELAAALTGEGAGAGVRARARARARAGEGEGLALTLNPNPSSTLFLGVDVARKKDLCVLDIGEKIGDVVWDRVRVEFLNRPFGEMEAELYRLLRLTQLKRACIDATGLGAQLAERARQRFGWKIEPILFTLRTKEDLATGLKIDLEKRHVRLVDDARLRADLRGIRKEVTLSGNSRYGGESGDSHCDRFWAKALRQEAARHRVCAGGRVA